MQGSNHKANHQASFFQVYSIQKQSDLKPQRNHQLKPFKIEEKQIEDQLENQQTKDDFQAISLISCSSRQSTSSHLKRQKVNQDEQNLSDQDTSQLIQVPRYSVKRVPNVQSMSSSLNKNSNNHKSISSSQKSRIVAVQDQTKSKILQQLLAFFDKADSINKIPDKISEKSKNFRQSSQIATDFLTNLRNQKKKLDTMYLSPNGKNLSNPGFDQIPQEESQLQKSRSPLKNINYSQQITSRNLDISKNSAFNFISFIQSQNFLIIPISKNRSFEFYLKREVEKSGCFSKIQYHLYQVNNFKYIVSAQESMNKFCIVRKKQTKNHQIGELSRSICGKKFQCFYFPRVKVDKDRTKKSLKSTKGGNKPSKQTSNIQLISIKYDTNLLGAIGPRKIQVYIPKVNHVIQNQNPLQDLYSKTDMIQKFVSKEPRYNEEIGCYKLGFKSKSIIDSKKNFQILNTNKQHKSDDLKQTNQLANQYLKQVPSIRYAKLASDLFHLQIQYPFSILQGFCVALSSFGHKI